MTKINISTINHLTLTISNLDKSLAFYTGLLNFQKVMDIDPRAVLLSNGNIIIALRTPWDPNQAIEGDIFNENRIGLDHLSFSVASVGELEEAIKIFDAHGISHGDIEDQRPLIPFYIMAFRDPDNIQLELTAPVG